MSDKIRITTTPEQLEEGLFGQVFLYAFELLPHLESQGIRPAWAIRSKLYGKPGDFVVIPGLLEINYDLGAENHRDVNLLDLRHRHGVTLGNDWEYVAGLWKKFFRLPERVIRRADPFPPLGRSLGIHYRGTDKNRSLVETNPVSQEDFLALVRDFVGTHPDIEAICVATDENDLVDKIRAQHTSLRIVHSGNVRHHKDVVLDDGFSKGDHALLDCLLLSRCRYLLKCQSALSGFAKILNPNLEAYRIAANKLSWWSWGNPYFPDAHLPKLTSQNPECQKILARLLAGDWTGDKWAVKKFGGTFRYKSRRRYMNQLPQDIPKWSLTGLQLRLDSRLDRLIRRLT